MCALDVCADGMTFGSEAGALAHDELTFRKLVQQAPIIEDVKSYKDKPR